MLKCKYVIKVLVNISRTDQAQYVRMRNEKFYKKVHPVSPFFPISMSPAQ